MCSTQAPVWAAARGPCAGGTTSRGHAGGRAAAGSGAGGVARPARCQRLLLGQRQHGQRQRQVPPLGRLGGRPQRAGAGGAPAQQQRGPLHDAARQVGPARSSRGAREPRAALPGRPSGALALGCSCLPSWHRGWQQRAVCPPGWPLAATRAGPAAAGTPSSLASTSRRRPAPGMWRRWTCPWTCATGTCCQVGRPALVPRCLPARWPAPRTPAAACVAVGKPARGTDPAPAAQRRSGTSSPPCWPSSQPPTASCWRTWPCAS